MPQTETQRDLRSKATQVPAHPLADRLEGGPAIVGYVKDNRLLPHGFDKATAPHDIVIQGDAADDADFQGGGDRVRYVIELADGGGPVTVSAELWYQPIGFRWAPNLKAFPAPETERFVGYYEATADASALVLAKDTARLER